MGGTPFSLPKFGKCLGSEIMKVQILSQSWVIIDHEDDNLVPSPRNGFFSFEAAS